MVRHEEQIGAKSGIKRGFQLEQSEKIPDPSDWLHPDPFFVPDASASDALRPMILDNSRGNLIGESAPKPSHTQD